MVKNKYNCANKIWNKFSEFEKKYWNMCYIAFNKDVNYPENLLDKKQLHIIAHNLACTATWQLPEFLIKCIQK